MDKRIKKRVLGSVVLLASAILFLPMLFSQGGVAVRHLEPPLPPEPPAITAFEDVAPSLATDAARLEQAIADSHGEPTFYPVVPPTVTAPAPAEAAPEQFRLQEPASPTARAQVAEKAREATPAATALPQAWVVQTASFSQQANAEAAVQRLKAKGHRASVQAGDGLWRVVVGPELERARAEAIRSEILADESLGMDALVRAYRP